MDTSLYARDEETIKTMDFSMGKGSVARKSHAHWFLRIYIIAQPFLTWFEEKTVRFGKGDNHLPPWQRNGMSNIVASTLLELRYELLPYSPPLFFNMKKRLQNIFKTNDEVIAATEDYFADF